MKFPKSEVVGDATDPDGKHYTLDFYGENEGAAVVSGPRPISGKLEPVPERHRESASNVADARAKLAAWCKAKGWNASFF